MQRDDDELLTLTQAAILLGTSYTKVYQQVRWGYLRAAVINNRYLLRTSEVERFRAEGLSRYRERRSHRGRPKKPTE